MGANAVGDADEALAECEAPTTRNVLARRMAADARRPAVNSRFPSVSGFSTGRGFFAKVYPPSFIAQLSYHTLRRGETGFPFSGRGSCSNLA